MTAHALVHRTPRAWTLATALVVAGSSTLSAQQGAKAPPPLALGERLSVIGALDDPVEQVFARPRGALLLDGGRVLVLDQNQLRLFDNHGAHLGTFAGTGGGPGELRAGWQFMQPTGKGVAVLDRPMQVVEYGWATQRSLEYVQSVRLPIPAGAACPWNGGYALVALNDKGLIHLSDATEQVTTHIGTAFGTGSPVRQEQLSNSILHCDAAQHRIAVGSTALGEVRGYDATSGRLLWTATLPGFVPMEVTDMPDGSVMNKRAPGGNHFLRVMLPMPDGRLLVQAPWDADPKDPSSLRPALTVAIDPRTGALTGPWSSLPTFADMRGDMALVVVPEAEFPQFAVHRIAAGGRR